MRTRTISDDTIREVQRRVDNGTSVKQACRGLGLTGASFYARRRTLPPEEPAAKIRPASNTNGCCAPDLTATEATLQARVTTLERLCEAQATLLAKQGIIVSIA